MKTIAAMTFALLVQFQTQAKVDQVKEIRTYMQFTFPVDPARVQTIPDMNMSYALASTLIEWDAAKSLSSGLAAKWAVIDEKIYRLTLREGSKWSDGQSLTSKHVKQSLERSMQAYPRHLRSLSNILTEITCPSLLDIDFHLKANARTGGLLEKLTEPNYGITRLAKNGIVDSTITSGAFSLAKGASESELVLVKNPHWSRQSAIAHLADRVVIRRLGDSVDLQRVLIEDKWPNLVETSSLIGDDLLVLFKSQGFKIWRRPLDKVLFLQVGTRSSADDMKSLLQYLGTEQSFTKTLLSGFSGYGRAEQFFPRGFLLFDKQYKCPSRPKFQAEKFNTLDILVSADRIPPKMQANLSRFFIETLNIKANIKAIRLHELRNVRAKGNFDIYIGSVGLADPDPEGAMSFYLETDTPVIQTKSNDFIRRLDQARKQPTNEDRLAGMRSILSDAVCQGYVLPIAHFSTIGIARPDLDLSQVPQTDESVTLSKVRFKGSM